MNINTSINSNLNRQNISFDKQENNYLVRLQKQMIMLDKRIGKVKESSQLSALEKQEKLKQLDEQKKELMIKIRETKIKEKMNEVEEKIEEAEEIEERRKEKEQKPLTPLEEIKVELGMDYMSSKMMIKASKALDSVNSKLRLSKKIRQEAKILDRQVETDRGRHQNIYTIDFRGKLSEKLRMNAYQAEDKGMEELDKINKLIKKASKKVDKTKEENNEINKEISKEENQEEVKYIEKKKHPLKQEIKKDIGENVDISV